MLKYFSKVNILQKIFIKNAARKDGGSLFARFGRVGIVRYIIERVFQTLYHYFVYRRIVLAGELFELFDNGTRDTECFVYGFKAFFKF